MSAKVGVMRFGMHLPLVLIAPLTSMLNSKHKHTLQTTATKGLFYPINSLTIFSEALLNLVSFLHYLLVDGN